MRMLFPLFRIMNPSAKTKATDKTFDEQIRNADESIRVLYENLSNYILSLGDDISESHLKLYAAFKKIRNVVTVVAQKEKADSEFAA